MARISQTLCGGERPPIRGQDASGAVPVIDTLRKGYKIEPPMGVAKKEINLGG